MTNNIEAAPMREDVTPLLPCPFCGGEAKYWVGKVEFVDVECGCDNCGCQGPSVNDYATVRENQAKAIAAWNHRLAHSASPDAGDEDVERDPDLDIAIGEDAFRAGFEAGRKWQTSVGYGSDVGSSEQGLYKAWSSYTPPEELCGGGNG